MVSTNERRAAGDVREDVRENVVFRLGDALLAVPVAAVREIIEPQALTPLPRAPRHVLGLIEVRGRSLAVVDVALKLGLGALSVHDATRLILLDIVDGGEERTLAVQTDGVLGVELLDEDDGDPKLPALGEAWSDRAIARVARRQGKSVLVVDLGEVFDRADVAVDGEKALKDAA